MSRAPKTTAQRNRDARRVAAVLNVALVPIMLATGLALANGAQLAEHPNRFEVVETVAP